MLENKEQEKIAGIISDFFDGQVTEADIDILALKIYENAFKDPKWQKLKEWLRKAGQGYMNDGFFDCAGAIFEVIDKMRELEGEDEI